MTSLTCWMDAWQQLGIAGGSELYASVHAAYQEPHRKYHSLQHLDECLLRFDEVKQHADHPAEVELALWFHDAIYDLARKDNELRSADWAKASIQACGLPAEIGSRVHSLIMMTVHNAVPAGRDAEALIDVDLSIFAAAPARFDEYEQQVRAEYVFVPEAVFRRERSRILQEFLQRERLYSTPYFREYHEPQARANLQRSISKLAG